jgi:hypothetical protein
MRESMSLSIDLSESLIIGTQIEMSHKFINTFIIEIMRKISKKNQKLLENITKKMTKKLIFNAYH